MNRFRDSQSHIYGIVESSLPGPQGWLPQTSSLTCDSCRLSAWGSIFWCFQGTCISNCPKTTSLTVPHQWAVPVQEGHHSLVSCLSAKSVNAGGDRGLWRCGRVEQEDRTSWQALDFPSSQYLMFILWLMHPLQVSMKAEQ